MYFFGLTFEPSEGEARIMIVASGHDHGDDP